MGSKRVYELILEIGHTSKPLSKRLPSGYTHKWTVFVRGNNNSKIEHCIQKVVFQLHDSFTNPHRDIYEPPFQVKETGYAGFEVPIEIYFKNREKPNHLTFVHDLALLTNKPNESRAVEKIKFINPNREFEKCLIKAGAQLMSMAVKKDRSDSPPAKKQKSSSLIPSKDMSNSHQLQADQKQKSSNKDFFDVFGAPLVYNKNKETKHHNSSQNNHNHHTSKHSNHHQLQHNQPIHNKQHQQQVQSTQQSSPIPQIAQQNQHNQPDLQNHNATDLQQIQMKISNLTDCDRLQKIVDIIEESGEWFNVTSKKFEFDLKRLDKKTLNKIEKCLH